MVFVLSKNKTPLAPTSEAKARILLKKEKAIIHKVYPFTIRLKENKECKKSFEIKFDVGASVTGVAIVDAVKCFFFAEIVHRGAVIKKAMDSRRAIRRSRRDRKTRYREPRFDNRTRPEGWLPPSVKSRADNVINFAKKYAKLIPIFSVAVEKDLSHLKPKKTPKQASIVQSARTYTIKELSRNFDVIVGEGWETYANRKELGLPKQHYYDAMCIGKEYKYEIVTDKVLEIKAQGRGSRQMCRMDRFGFPRTKAKSSKIVKGFQTGDIMKAIVSKGKKIGTYLGKVAVRASGNFNITTTKTTIQGINYKYCRTIQKGDGYAYAISTIK